VNAYDRSDISRRKALGLAGIFLVAAACSPEKLFGPCALPPSDEPPPDPAPAPELRDVYIVDGFTGLQLGTKDNPYSVRSAQEFDALFQFLQSNDALAIKLSGRFKTAGSFEWGNYGPSGWRAGKYWTFDGDAEIAIDPNAIADYQVDDPPLRIITYREQIAWGDWDALAADQVWAGLPRGQAVRGLTLVGNHSLLADRWRAKNKVLRTGGCILQGHNAAIENVRFVDFGALKMPGVYAEGFPAVICGAMGAPDRNKVAQLDGTTHVYDSIGEPSHITGCTFDGFAPSSSNDQVSVFVIIGSAGEPGGVGSGNWQQTMRANCHQSNNAVEASGSNSVQGYTIYNALRGRVAGNRTRGVSMGYYGDYYATKGIVIEGNDFEALNHGVALYLSPTAGDDPHLPEQFSHEDYTIGANRIRSAGANVSLNSFGSSTSTRFIRGIRVHPDLSLESVGAEFTREGCGLAA
jgi:hypothetical protein